MSDEDILKAMMDMKNRITELEAENKEKDKQIIFLQNQIIKLIDKIGVNV